MELVSGFAQLLQPLASTMTAPTFDSLRTVLTGWVFARRRTVTRMILGNSPFYKLILAECGGIRYTFAYE